LGGRGIGKRASKLLGFSVTSKDMLGEATFDNDIAEIIRKDFYGAIAELVVWVSALLCPDIIVIGGSVALSIKQADITIIETRLAGGLNCPRIILLKGEPCGCFGAARAVWS
jgi:hypothetical protein